MKEKSIGWSNSRYSRPDAARSGENRELQDHVGDAARKDRRKKARGSKSEQGKGDGWQAYVKKSWGYQKVVGGGGVSTHLTITIFANQR